MELERDFGRPEERAPEAQPVDLVAHSAERAERMAATAGLVAEASMLVWNAGEAALPECEKAERILTEIVETPERYAAWNTSHVSKRVGTDRMTYSRLAMLYANAMLCLYNEGIRRKMSATKRTYEEAGWNKERFTDAVRMDESSFTLTVVDDEMSWVLPEEWKELPPEAQDEKVKECAEEAGERDVGVTKLLQTEWYCTMLFEKEGAFQMYSFRPCVYLQVVARTTADCLWIASLDGR